MTDMEIETFLTVLRCGSMTAAAQALYITQPTLSARLQTLEDEVGTPLFVRGKGLRRLELTDAGSRFLPLAQRWQWSWPPGVSAAIRRSCCTPVSFTGPPHRRPRLPSVRCWRSGGAPPETDRRPHPFSRMPMPLRLPVIPGRRFFAHPQK